MVKPRLLKRLTISVTLFKQILAVSPIRRESSKYFTDICPLELFYGLALKQELNTVNKEDKTDTN